MWDRESLREYNKYNNTTIRVQSTIFGVLSAEQAGDVPFGHDAEAVLREIGPQQLRPPDHEKHVRIKRRLQRTREEREKRRKRRIHKQ